MLLNDNYLIILTFEIIGAKLLIIFQYYALISMNCIIIFANKNLFSFFFVIFL